MYRSLGIFIFCSSLLHLIHGHGVFQHSNIISNLTGLLAYRVCVRAFTRRRMKTNTNDLRSI